jgi:hypothetical protein
MSQIPKPIIPHPCVICKEMLIKMERESNARFNARKTCDPSTGRGCRDDRKRQAAAMGGKNRRKEKEMSACQAKKQPPRVKSERVPVKPLDLSPAQLRARSLELHHTVVYRPICLRDLGAQLPQGAIAKYITGEEARQIYR